MGGTRGDTTGCPGASRRDPRPRRGRAHLVDTRSGVTRLQRQVGTHSGSGWIFWRFRLNLPNCLLIDWVSVLDICYLFPMMRVIACSRSSTRGSGIQILNNFKNSPPRSDQPGATAQNRGARRHRRAQYRPGSIRDTHRRTMSPRPRRAAAQAAAAEGAQRAGQPAPTLLAVTVLTSWEE